jgi:HK97 family phage major capsid protein
MDEAVHFTDEQFRSFLETMGAGVHRAVEDGAREAVGVLAGAGHAGKAVAALGAGDAEADRMQRFFKAVLAGDTVAAKDLSESTTTAGGFLVPAGFRNEVVRRLPELSELAGHVRTVPVVTDTGSLPSLATDISITWRAAASSENTAFGATEPVLGSIPWSLKRADALTKMSRELVADSAPGVVEFVTRLFREAIAAERDRVIAVGDGTDEPAGISGASGTGSVDVAGAIDFAGLVEIEQTLAKKYRRNARWIMNGTNLQRIHSLADTAGQPIFVRDVVGGVPESRILGYPVAQQDGLADGEILFGDLSQYLWFDRGEMGIESTNEGGDAFANHQTWIKVWERVDGKLALPEAFVKASGITS